MTAAAFEPSRQGGSRPSSGSLIDDLDPTKLAPGSHARCKKPPGRPGGFDPRRERRAVYCALTPSPAPVAMETFCGSVAVACRLGGSGTLTGAGAALVSAGAAVSLAPRPSQRL